MSHDNDRYGGVIHTYRGYDPLRFPMPDAPRSDALGAAFEHLIAYGTLENLSPEALAEAIELDPSQITGLGPSIESLLAMLEQRKRKILETFETRASQAEADRAFRDWTAAMGPPGKHQKRFLEAVRDEQIVDLERLWYRVDQRSDFARHLVVAIEHLGRKYEVEQLAAAYEFTGRQEMSLERALEIKEELETIDRLIEQLKQAAKDAKLYRVDLDKLAQFASAQQMEDLETMARQVQQILEHLAQQQGLKQDGEQYQLTPKAMRVMQSRLLDQIFSGLQASKTGRHDQAIVGDGQVETQRTKPYEFGDSLANMDVGSSMVNAMIRTGAQLPVRMEPKDIEIHVTRNTPKCATVVCMDMSGSMRWSGQYINVKRMALALHGLVRREYPGDYLDFVEVYTLPKRRHVSEIPALLPKPVTVHRPIVRFKVDMGQEGINEFDIPPHFTNLQQGLALARRLLEVQDTPNRQIVLITDGLPTAHFEDQWLYMLYPPDPRTEKFTMREGLLCKERGIVINLFLLSTWAQSQEDVQFAHRLAERTGGRVFFTGGDDLDRFVVWDYVQRKRFIVG